MKRYSLALLLVCLCAVPARAQETLLQSCVQALPQGPDITQDVQDQFHFLCAQVVNSLIAVQPGVGIAFSGGNPVLGTGTTLGRRLGILPRVSVTARANGAFIDMPGLFDGFSPVVTNEQPALPPMETVGVPVGSLQGDISIGLLNGISLGPTVGGFGAVDLLGSVSFVPVIEKAGISETITNFGLGARVGILEQGLVVPGISVSGMFRRMGDVTFGDIEAGDAGEFTTDLTTWSVRAVASKGVLMLDFAIGAGYDRYSSDTALDWRLTCATQNCLDENGDPITAAGQIAGELSSSAWNVFGDVSLNLLVINLVGEIGYQKAIEGLTPDDLRDAGVIEQDLSADALNGGHLFGSVGLRFTL
ncbi:MAG TPA: hypothetical protein VF188_12565 [Longimicrobiales bacterium]